MSEDSKLKREAAPAERAGVTFAQPAVIETSQETSDIQENRKRATVSPQVISLVDSEAEGEEGDSIKKGTAEEGTQPSTVLLSKKPIPKDKPSPLVSLVQRNASESVVEGEAKKAGVSTAEEEVEPIRRKSYLCALCGKDMSVQAEVSMGTIKNRLDHFKKCAAHHRCTNPKQLRQFLRQGKAQPETREKAEEADIEGEREVEVLVESCCDSDEEEDGYLSDLIREVELQEKHKEKEKENIVPKRDVHSVLMRSAKQRAKPDVNTYLMNPQKRSTKSRKKGKGGYLKKQQSARGQKQATKPKREAPLCKKVPGTAFVVDGFKFVSCFSFVPECSKFYLECSMLLSTSLHIFTRIIMVD